MSKRNFHDCRRNKKALAWREGQSLGPMRERMPPVKPESTTGVKLNCSPVDMKSYVSIWTRDERRKFIRDYNRILKKDGSQKMLLEHDWALNRSNG